MSNSDISTLANLHERMISRLPTDNTGHDHTRKLAGAVARLAHRIHTIDTMHKSQSPTETPEAHQKKILKAAATLAGKNATTFDDMQAITRDGLREIQVRIDQKTNLLEGAFGRETRDRFYTLDLTAKINLLGEWVEAGNGPALASVLKAPTYLTGLTSDLQTRFLQAHTAKQAPAEMEEQGALVEAFNTALICIDTAKAAAQSYSDPIKLASIESGEAAAATAMDAFIKATA